MAMATVAALPCLLCRPVSVSMSMSPPPLVPSSASFSPLNARKQHISTVVIAKRQFRPCARLGQDYDSDFSQPDTVPKDTEILHSSDKEQSVMLRFVWLDKCLGLALEHVFPGYGAIPLTPYYLFPQTDALEELKKNIQSQRWISLGRTKALLSQAEELLFLWQNTAI